MSEFSAAANLSVSVDEGELRSVRREIERGVGDVTAGVDVNTMRPDGGRPTGAVPSGSPSAMQGQLGGMLDASTDLVDLAETRNDLLDDLVNRSGGGGGGGGVLGSVGAAGLGARLAGGGGLGSLLTGAAPLLAGGAVATAGAAGMFEGFRNTGGLENLDRLLSGDWEQGARTPTWEEAAGTGISMLGGPIGMLASEEITGFLEDAELPEPSWVPDLLNWSPDPPKIGRDELSDRVREADPAGSERAGDVNTQSIIDQTRTAQRVRETGAAGSERAGDVNTQEVMMNSKINANFDVLVKDDRNLDREMEKVKREIEERIRREISSGAGGRFL